jgi:hypothetical protein
MRPVTHVAEVAVKRAVPNEVTVPLRDETGSIKRTVPRAIRPANPRMTILEEDGFIRFERTDNVVHPSSLGMPHRIPDAAMGDLQPKDGLKMLARYQMAHICIILGSPCSSP